MNVGVAECCKTACSIAVAPITLLLNEPVALFFWHVKASSKTYSKILSYR